MIIIRHEQPADIDAIRRVNDRAFNTPEEAILVDQVGSPGTELEFAL